MDDDGWATVTGITLSGDFPTTPGAYDTSINSMGFHEDGFVARLSADGSALIYGTFLGGNHQDRPAAIAVDGADRAFVVGWTNSRDFPTTPGAIDTSCNDTPCDDGFVTSLSADGSVLSYSTFLGGTGDDRSKAVVVNGTGSAYVTGYTALLTFLPLLAPSIPRFNNGDAFVAKLNPVGTALAYATFVGGSDGDGGSAIVVDGAGSAYVAGETVSSDFPTTSNAFDTGYNGWSDAFVTRLSSDGSSLVFATYLGGYFSDAASSIAVDSMAQIIVVGNTISSDFPTTPDAFDRRFDYFDYLVDDAFIARLSADGSDLTYGTFLGGAGSDYAFGGVIDSMGRVIAVGSTYSVDFPITAGAYNPGPVADMDSFVTRLWLDTPCVSALRTAQPPQIDGDLSDWASWQPLFLSRDTAATLATQPTGSSPPSIADNSADLWAVWTATDLYFAIHVRDDRIFNDSPQVWKDDEIELAFVGAYDGIASGGDSHQYTFNPDGRITDFGQASPPIQAAASLCPTDGLWKCGSLTPISLACISSCTQAEPSRSRLACATTTTAAIGTATWFAPHGHLVPGARCVAPRQQPHRTNSAADPYAHCDPYNNANGDGHADAVAHHADTERDNADANSYRHAVGHCNLDGNAHTNADDNADSHGDDHADIDTNRAPSLPAADSAAVTF